MFLAGCFGASQSFAKDPFDPYTETKDVYDARYVWMDVTGVGHTGNFGHAINEFEIFMAKE